MPQRPSCSLLYLCSPPSARRLLTPFPRPIAAAWLNLFPGTPLGPPGPRPDPPVACSPAALAVRTWLRPASWGLPGFPAASLAAERPDLPVPIAAVAMVLVLGRAALPAAPHGSGGLTALRSYGRPNFRPRAALPPLRPPIRIRFALALHCFAPATGQLGLRLLSQEGLPAEPTRDRKGKRPSGPKHDKTRFPFKLPTQNQGLPDGGPRVPRAQENQQTSQIARLVHTGPGTRLSLFTPLPGTGLRSGLPNLPASRLLVLPLARRLVASFLAVPAAVPADRAGPAGATSPSSVLPSANVFRRTADRLLPLLYRARVSTVASFLITCPGQTTCWHWAALRLLPAASAPPLPDAPGSSGPALPECLSASRFLFL
eukprot:16448403-Heterocapsa_arctica.AAC.1